MKEKPSNQAGIQKAKQRRNRKSRELRTALMVGEQQQPPQSCLEETVTKPEQRYGKFKLTHFKCRKCHTKGELGLHNLVQDAKRGKGKKKGSCKYRKTPKRKKPAAMKSRAC